MSGTTDGGEVRWDLTKALNDNAAGTGATGRSTAKGTLDASGIRATCTDHNSRPSMSLRRER